MQEKDQVSGNINKYTLPLLRESIPELNESYQMSSINGCAARSRFSRPTLALNYYFGIDISTRYRVFCTPMPKLNRFVKKGEANPLEEIKGTKAREQTHGSKYVSIFEGELFYAVSETTAFEHTANNSFPDGS
ncbi:MAG: hypothetical protein LBP21_08720 [Synergistaceae bacterium]|nr:hypothetical protein [Synergistaceae bacterium]